ncbi:hypothetical protein [Shewanella halifaxensis]|uniref:hypothetical protein n=1 Tax=Shewanella halifaxensis TaxID=271098 RepID=UPI000D58CDB4|nr:hypothetical protein [Shewanella halifaxensis]
MSRFAKFEGSNKRKIVLHVGLPKTATTSIQDSIFANAKLLKQDHGIDYCVDLCDLADVKCTGHHPLAWATFFPAHPHSKPINGQIVKERLQLSDNIFLSSEWFTTANQLQIASIVEEWGLPTDRRVLLVYRNEFDHIRSSWLQAIKMGYSFLSLEEFYFQRYKPTRNTIADKVKKWAMHGFSVEVLSFDDLKKSGNDMAIEVLNRVYDIKIDQDKWGQLTASNVSPPRGAVNLYRKLIHLLNSVKPSFTASWTEAEYHLLHNKMCGFLAHIPFVSGKQDQVEDDKIRDDLVKLPTFFDPTQIK